MNPQLLLPACIQKLFSKTRLNETARRWRHVHATAGFLVVGLMLVLPTMAKGQAIRFRSGLVRVTVPINSTNSTTITNFVNLSGVTNADLTVTGLPTGASAVITDTNSVPTTVTTVTTDTNLNLTVNTTNIAEGIYTFSVNASGLDTNGAPVTNYVLYVLQAAHVWNGGIATSNNWANASSWAGGVPTSTSDVVFGDTGAQTNIFTSGLLFTNVGIDADTTVASIRFSQSGITNSVATNSDARAISYGIRIGASRTLSVTGTNGFSLMRDYIDDIQGLGTMSVQIGGGTGSKMIVSNANANFSILVGNTARPTLNMSNVESMVTYVSRLGIAEYQLFPNYRNYNDLNQFGDNPRRFVANIYLPRTNTITAIWKDSNDYTNEITRTYPFSFENSEVSGVGSGTDIAFYLGQSNAFFVEGVGLVRANHATGNNGSVRFNPAFPNGIALFRSTNGGRMSVFTVSDDGGTNNASSNVKATIDFASGNGTIDMLVDRLYVARDRTMIASNQTPNVQGDLIIGKGIVDANTVILGFQEHSNKVDWTSLYGADPYLNYCQGRLVVTNGGTFRVRGTMNLGFTADTNPEGSAQQYNTYGQITVYSNSTLAVSNIVVDGGLNYSSTVARNNRITLNQGAIMVVSNTIGAVPGLKLDNLSMAGATNIMFLNPARTNIIVKNLANPGSVPAVIKVASLTGVSSYPVQIPLISYETAAPFMVADVTALGAGFFGYILDNQDNKTIDIFITTNAANNLVWRGNNSSDWDTTTTNWVTAVGSIPTKFTLGDIVTFDDTSTVTNVNVVGSVVPGQSGSGVTFNNSARRYTLSGGTVAGTSLLVKQGTNILTLEVTKQGPVNLVAGTINGGSSFNASVGGITVFSNTVFSYGGFVNGALTSTGTVALASSATVFGPVTLRGGTLSNSGTFSNTTPAFTITGIVGITNTLSGTMYIGGGNYDLPNGCTLANFGTIYNTAGRLNFEGLVYGTGAINDIDGGLSGVDGRFSANPLSLWSPGNTPYGSIGTMTVGARVDFNNTPNTAPFGLAQLRIEVDFSNPQTNDLVGADKWNNITGMLLMTNINPGAGTFAAGQSFLVFSNTAGVNFPNFIDVNGTYPTMWPPLPAPGLQWGLGDFRAFGRITVTNSAYVWNGNLSGNWDTNTANWKNANIYADGQGAFLDDSASGSTTITLTNVVAPIGVILVTNIIPTVSTNIITNTPVMSPGVVVSNGVKNYTISGSGRLSGMTGLYKTGPGTLTLLTSNDFTGNVIVDGGTIEFSNAPPSTSIATFGFSGNNNEVLMDGGTLRYIGNTNVSFANFLFINPGGSTLEIASSTNEVNMNKNVVGNGALTKTGPGTLALGQTGNSYPGGTTISQGTLRLRDAGLGSGGVTFAGGTAMILTNAFNFTNAINIAGAGVTWQLGANTNVLGGDWTGSGTLATTGTNLGQLIINGSMGAFAGVISLGGSTNSIQFNNASNSTPCTGSSVATYDLGTGAGALNVYYGGGLTYNLGALAGGANTVLFGSATNTGTAACTYSIGANGSNTVFSGRITNGSGSASVAITKVGTGSLTLGGANTYSGATIVSGGKLLVNNTTGSGTGSGSVSVGSSATLGGNGTISGAVSVAAGGTLSPGTSIGRLTVNNSLTLAASSTTIIEVSKNGSTLTNDNVAGLSSVSFNGSLVVSNIGPGALAGGDSFKLFNIGGTGNFTSITPALASPQSWSFNPANGVLTVVDPRVISFSRSGNNITFSWTGTSKLQAQTNTITGTWVDYPGGGSSPVTITVDPNQTDVFFRLAPGP